MSDDYSIGFYSSGYDEHDPSGPYDGQKSTSGAATYPHVDVVLANRVIDEYPANVPENATGRTAPAGLRHEDVGVSSPRLGSAPPGPGSSPVRSREVAFCSLVHQRGAVTAVP